MGVQRCNVVRLFCNGLGINIPFLMDLLPKQKVQQNQIDIDKLEIDIKDTKLGLDQAYQNKSSN